MENESDAEAAIAKLHNSEFDGVKINVEMSHGKRGGGGGGPMRRRFNDHGPRRDYRDDRYGPPRTAYGRDGPRGMGPSGGYPPMREGRYDGPPSWGGDNYSPYPPRGPPRGYDNYNGSQGRYPSRDYDRGPRGPRDMPYGGGYQGSNPEPVPPPRDMARKQSPPRGRYDSYGSSSYGDYDRYRDQAPPPSGPPQRSGDYYENYGSYGGGSSNSHDYGYVIICAFLTQFCRSRDYRDNERGGNYGSSYDYDYYGSRGGNRSPPRGAPSYGYGRP